MRISDWSSDVCSSDLGRRPRVSRDPSDRVAARHHPSGTDAGTPASLADAHDQLAEIVAAQQADQTGGGVFEAVDHILDDGDLAVTQPCAHLFDKRGRSEEHTSELQSLMRISYAVFCLKKKKHYTPTVRVHTLD